MLDASATPNAYCIHCGNRILRGSRFCSSCGQRQDSVSIQTVSESHEPIIWGGSHPLTTKQGFQIAAGFGALLVILLIFSFGKTDHGVSANTESPPEVQRTPSTAPAAIQPPQQSIPESKPAPFQPGAEPANAEPINAAAAPLPSLPPPPPHKEIPLPASEIAFMEAVSSFPARYKQAANEFQKSALRRERATSLSQILQAMSVTDWVGTIVEMKTNSDGLGILFVSLPSTTQIRLETWNNGFSDIGFDTMIPQSSPLYTKLAGYAKGTSIVFSGKFWPQGLDYINETSLTEEGSMTDPEYVFKFSELESLAEFQKEK
jgi:hypothetical protein